LGNVLKDILTHLIDVCYDIGKVFVVLSEISDEMANGVEGDVSIQFLDLFVNFSLQATELPERGS